MGCYESWYAIEWYVEGRLGYAWKKVKEYDSNLPIIFGIVECLMRLQCKEVMGKIRKLVLVEIFGKQVVSLEEVITTKDEWWWLHDRESKSLEQCG